MIVLDTNVLSALMRASPEPQVVSWLDRQPSESVWITSINLFEARLGLALLPAGRRRRALESAFVRLVEEDLENRVLDLDRAAAVEAASLAAERQRTGKPVDMRDTLIAGIVLSRRATLATRNVRHFSDLDVAVVDPWALPGSLQQTPAGYRYFRSKLVVRRRPGERHIAREELHDRAGLRRR